MATDVPHRYATRSWRKAWGNRLYGSLSTLLGIRPRRLAADTAYGAAPILKWLMDRGIEPHIPVWDKSRRADGTFSRPDFT